VKKNKKNSNVVSFPGMYERTVEKGRIAMEENDHETAMNLFSLAHAQNPEDEYVAFCLMFAFDGINDPEGAIKVFEDFFKEYEIEDFEMVMFYLNMLFESRKYLEIQHFIQTLRFSKRIPKEYQHELEQFESLNQKLSVDRDMSRTAETLSLEKVEEELASDSNPIKFTCISELGMANIRQFMEPIKKFLVSENHPTLKSMLFSTLIDQEVDEEIAIIQLGEKLTLNPKECVAFENFEFRNELLNGINDIFESTHPGIFEEAINVIDAHLLLQFPIEMDDVKNWIIAYEFYLKQAYGIPTKRILTIEEQGKLFKIKSLDEIPSIFE
jgi:tetratricopeptide (TPR) repeat protein